MRSYERGEKFNGSHDDWSGLQGAQSDSGEESVSTDLKDLEFKLLHDITQLQVG